MGNKQQLSFMVQKEIVRLNVLRMRTVAWTWMYATTVITFVHFSELFFAVDERKMVPLYAVIHTIMFYINLAILLFIKKNKLVITESNIAKYKKIVWGYIHINLLLVTIITVVDVYFFHHVVLYEVIFLVICVVFVLPLRTILGGILVTLAIVLGTAYYSMDVAREGTTMFLALALLIPIGLMIQWYMYSVQKQYIIQQILLGAEVVRSKQTSELLAGQVMRDTLTNIPNRRAFNEKIQQLDEQKELAVLMIDIDFFKNFNDSYGHIQGDKALKAVAIKLQQVGLKNSAFVARWGGEEFVLVSQSNREQAEELCQQIIAAIHDLGIPHRGSPIANRVTVSIGMCWTHSSAREKIYQCCTFSDEALYQAKQNGRNGYYIQGLDQVMVS
ncbi:GGDEF domain-containing protein [Lysinibacillus piscis]|uniref:GGDEF domain-containing protein n=1 Tax=Lysinibacillus piscis TaxID=2518931 RepID=A0ABQ5NH73_9BACI|nr:GGDEF domain-containing protein [Lysinibacillus sp. KH24]GLC87442.1 GGDEF domain-containing protein [Lysinibacillus sp. KH24]